MSNQRSRTNSLVKYFLYLFIRPTATIRQILQERPSFKRITIFLFCIGLLRGLIDGVWQLLMAAQFSQTVSSWTLSKSQLVMGTSFIFANITTGYSRWIAFTLIAYIFGKIAGGTGKVMDFLRVYGIILGIFLVTALPNFAHLFLKLPIIQFSVSKIYNPTIGVGQVLTSCWLAYISYKAVRVIHDLSAIDSILIGLSVPLINMGTLIFGAKIFFNIPKIISLTERKLFSLATFVFIAATLLSIPLLLWLVYWISRKSRLKNSGKLSGNHNEVR